PALGTTRSGLPTTLTALVARCLEKDPSRRPSSVSEILQTLDGITTPSEITPRVSMPARVRMSRVRWIAAAVAFLGALVATWLAARTPATTSGMTRTIVVMPFDNLGSASDAYFADGVSEEIASRLGQIPGMRVVGRASAARFKASNRSAEDVAR